MPNTTMFNNVTAYLEWMVAENKTCDKARSNQSSFACASKGKNTEYDDFGNVGGYRCVCNDGGRDGGAMVTMTATFAAWLG
ncbi:hypothetical protein NL676_025383 [Syzygium grande]|nr:hypothetical protein NL676_025383 [Syzygium grande]